MTSDLVIRRALPADLDDLETIRQRAFAPVFASFRQILGDEIYRRAQQPEDEQQSAILAGMLAADSIWQLYVALRSDVILGFVSIRLDRDAGVGEIGLNAVDPEQAGAGIGTELYRFALDVMRDAGLRVATVATGGDGSHAPARRAYEKAGFDVQIPSVWMCREL